ncbi:MAG: hypothetical protein JWO26_3060 [Rhodospirillales bacterium]|nr:hypothetical protein [Rhodospirillales bacterium]
MAKRSGFAGFPADAEAFLVELAATNNREWYLANKTRHAEAILAPAAALIESLNFAFAVHDLPLRGDPRKSVFRLHRDTRFSADKTPYKSHAGIVFSRDGSRATLHMLYIQVGGEDGPFMGMGFYMPPPAELAALRDAIAEAPEDWAAMLAGLRKAKLSLEAGDPLQRMPKGFEGFAGTPVAADLKRRHFTVRRRIPPARMGKPELVSDVLAFARAGLPLLSFGAKALHGLVPTAMRRAGAAQPAGKD